MSIFNLFLTSLVLCVIYYFVILTFPENYKQSMSKKKIDTLLLVSISLYILMSIVLFVLNKKFKDLLVLDLKETLLVIPLISIILFSINIYYPAVRIVVHQRNKDMIFIEEMQEIIFDYKYMPLEQREEALKKFEFILVNHRQELRQSGLELYIKKLIEQSNGITNKAPIALIDSCENKFVIYRRELEEVSLCPFSNISMISSFSLSCILTILLTYVTLL